MRRVGGGGTAANDKCRRAQPVEKAPTSKNQIRKEEDGEKRQEERVRAERRPRELSVKLWLLNSSRMPSNAVKETPERSGPLTASGRTSAL